MSLEDPATDVAPADRRGARRSLRWIGALLLLAAIAVVVTGLVTRRAQSTVLHERAEALAVPTVIARPDAAC